MQTFHCSSTGLQQFAKCFLEMPDKKDQVGQNKGTSAVSPALIVMRTVVLDHLLAEGVLQLLISLEVQLQTGLTPVFRRCLPCAGERIVVHAVPVMADNSAD
jgi:hypothetical protein